MFVRINCQSLCQGEWCAKMAEPLYVLRRNIRKSANAGLELCFSLLEISKFGMTVFFYPESKMPLGEIRDNDDNYGGYGLACQNFPLEDLHEQFKQGIIYQEVKSKGEKITKKLDSPS